MTDTSRTEDKFPRIAPYTVDHERFIALNRCNWTVDRSLAALMIYDMQQWYVDRYIDAAPLLDNICAIREAAEAAGIPVIFAAADPVRHLAERGVATDLWGPGIGAVGDATGADHEMHTRLLPGPHDFVIRKRKYSAFFETGLEALLRRMNRSQIIMTGNYANHGCTVTTVDAYMRNFRVFFTSDALGAFDTESHELALRFVSDICGQITLTRTVLDQIPGN